MKIVPKVPGSNQCNLTVLSPDSHLRSSVNLSKYWQIFTTLAPKLSAKRAFLKFGSWYQNTFKEGERGRGKNTQVKSYLNMRCLFFFPFPLSSLPLRDKYYLLIVCQISILGAGKSGKTANK